MGHDGLARAINPVHTVMDGDTIFGLSTCVRPAPLVALACVRPQLECLRHQLGRDPGLRMGFRFLVEGMLDHRRQDSRRVADADDVDARRDQPLRQVVHRQIRGRAGQDLFAARGGTADQLHQHRRLSGSRRAVDQHHVLRALRQLQGERLLGIEGVIDPRRGPRALIEPGAISAKHRMPAARLAHPAHRA